MRWRVWIASSIAFLFAAAGAELLVSSLFGQSPLLAQAVDVQSSETYFAKLDLIERHHLRGPTVVVIGDSQVVGETMADHGDTSWRDHTIDRVLERRLIEMGFQDVLVVNLAANGLLPADLDLIIRDTLSVGVDAIVFNLGLRAFSTDFDTDAGEFSRPWLKQLCREGRLIARCGWLGRLARASALYQVLDFLQHRYLGGAYRYALANGVEAAFKQRLRPAPSQDDFTNELALMVRARSRLGTLSLDPSHRQVQALKRALENLREHRARAVAIYSTENRVQFDQIIDPNVSARLRTALLGLVRQYEGETFRVVPPLPELSSSHFLDFMHLNYRGYLILANQVAPSVADLLRRPKYGS